MKKVCGLFLCLILSSICIGQSKKYPPTDKQNTILAEVVKKMAEPNVCGNSDLATKEFYAGTIIKRNFNDSEILLSSFVLKDKKDKRVLIHIDTEYVDNLAASASQDLAAFLVKGRSIKVWVYRCRRILYAYKISS